MNEARSVNLLDCKPESKVRNGHTPWSPGRVKVVGFLRCVQRLVWTLLEMNSKEETMSPSERKQWVNELWPKESYMSRLSTADNRTTVYWPETI